jgi:hypothetical protein
MAMDELAERLKASLENPNREPWFPELTADLAGRAWDSLNRDIGLTPDSYGTERVLSRSISAPRKIITSLKTGPSTCSPPSAILIEALSPELATKYWEQGFSFYSAGAVLNTTILQCLEDALTIIKQVPSLMRTVATLVRSLHVLKPEDVDYDVSFSEPHVTFSIFVSVPEKRIANDALRVAEAIVHETMHLQLTLIEKHNPLVLAEREKYFSPWRNDSRDARGVLHGLYVFSAVSCFYSALQKQTNGKGEVTIHNTSRLCEIEEQIGTLRLFGSCSDLTAVGRCFAKTLINSILTLS